MCFPAGMAVLCSQTQSSWSMEGTTETTPSVTPSSSTSVGGSSLLQTHWTYPGKELLLSSSFPGVCMINIHSSVFIQVSSQECKEPFYIDATAFIWNMSHVRTKLITITLLFCCVLTRVKTLKFLWLWPEQKLFHLYLCFHSDSCLYLLCCCCYVWLKLHEWDCN